MIRFGGPHRLLPGLTVPFSTASWLLLPTGSPAQPNQVQPSQAQLRLRALHGAVCLAAVIISHAGISTVTLPTGTCPLCTMT